MPASLRLPVPTVASATASAASRRLPTADCGASHRTAAAMHRAHHGKPAPASGVVGRWCAKCAEAAWPLVAAALLVLLVKTDVLEAIPW